MNTEARSQYNRDYYRKNKSRFKADAAARRARIRDMVAEIKVDRGCSICSYRRCSGALGFHHRTEDKEFTISYAVARGWSEKRILDEIAKCDVLCANCHHERHRGERA